jgi:aminoglycoside phosphotransferase (APT) family kinase protein
MSLVMFAETRLGSVAIKHAGGQRLAALRREKQVLDALRTSGLPVPEELLYYEGETGQETEGWLVTRRLPGEPLEKVLQEATPPVRASLLDKTGRLVARLHAMPIPAVLRRESKDWLDAMLDLAETSLPSGHWDGSPARLEELRQRRPDPVRLRLIHGDLFLDNILTDGEEITGLVDWAFGAAGDPRYDLTVAIMDLPPQDLRIFLEAYGIPGGLSDFETEYYRELAVFC